VCDPKYGLSGYVVEMMEDVSGNEGVEKNGEYLFLLLLLERNLYIS
jgi:hypothetical protein